MSFISSGPRGTMGLTLGDTLDRLRKSEKGIMDELRRTPITLERRKEVFQIVEENRTASSKECRVCQVCRIGT
jgi:hypothetical protein